MPLRRSFALLLLLACIASAITMAKSEKERGKGKRDRSKDETTGTGRQASRGAGGSKGAFKGKFSTKDKTQCTWAASGEDTFTLTVTCAPGKGETQRAFSCEYRARPASCPGYDANSKGYWKQVARSLKKQKKLCQDPRALLKAGMCKRAPQDAHFRLVAPADAEIAKPKPTRQARKPERTTKPTNTAAAGNPPESTSTGLECTKRIDHEELAQEKCGETWATLCNLFFTFVQSRDC